MLQSSLELMRHFAAGRPREQHLFWRHAADGICQTLSMAVVTSDDELYPPSGTECLLCLGDFSDGQPAVYWRGGQDLFLHGGCAGTFVLRLARDAWQLERDADDDKFELTKDR